MIDVIMPAYLPTKDHHDMLLRAIDTLENQSYKDFKVIVVLNGCYTDYETIIKSVDSSLDIRWLTLEGKASGAIARNFGISHSKAKYIAQLDADDQYHVDKLRLQIEFFEKNSDYDFVGTLAADYYGPDNIRDSIFEKGQYETHLQICRGLLMQNVMCHSSIMFKRKSFSELGGYVENYKPGDVWPEYNRRMWEDWDLWKRAVQKGFKFYNIQKRLYYWSTNTSVER